MGKQNRLTIKVIQKMFMKTSMRVFIFSSTILLVAFTVLFIYTNLGTAKKSSASLGLHGSKIISTTNVILNEFTALTSNAAAGATSITVSSSSLNANSRFPANLSAGDLVMIIQMQGATLNTASSTSSTWGAITAYNNAGKHEFNEVQSVPDGTTINLVSPLLNSYTVTGKVQVVRVPRYTTLTINAGASLTTQAWNGSTGGVIAIEDSGTTIINGTIDVSGLGFRGGVLKQTSTCCPAGAGIAASYATTNNAQGAARGEGIGGDTTAYDGIGGRYGRGAAANGGGGGNCHNAGGGGGSNGNNGVTWNGLGIPDTTTDSYWKQAWDLEGGSFHANVSSGGGRGGYTYNFKNKDPLTIAPGNTTWNGDNRSNVGGWGGRPLDNSGNRIYMGGGGGAGDANNGTGSGGATGGGIVYILVGGTLSGSGTINANGNDGGTSTGNDAAGGAGGGGSVIIYTSGLSATGVSVNAKGGKGGSQVRISNSSGEGEGPGGGGGGGYIAVSTPNSLTKNVTGGVNGTTNSPTFTTFIPNGATKAASGITTVAFNPYSGTVPLPITLKSFYGEVKNKTIELHWVTESEINNDYFTIEKSGDGNHFHEIGKVDGAGNSTIENNYKLVDYSPLRGTNFYRLSQTDFDGTVKKFTAICLNFKNNPAGVSIRFAGPNPCNDILTVDYSLDETGIVEIQILNSIGQLIRNRKVVLEKGTNSFTMTDVAELNKGIYFIQLVREEQKSIPVKIMKN
jgi:hypothetical protein